MAHRAQSMDGKYGVRIQVSIVAIKHNLAEYGKHGAQEHGKHGAQEHGKHGAQSMDGKYGNMILVIILAINPTLAMYDQHLWLATAIPRPAMGYPIRISHRISHTCTIPWYDTSEIPYHGMIPVKSYTIPLSYGTQRVDTILYYDMAPRGSILYYPISFRPLIAINIFQKFKNKSFKKEDNYQKRARNSLALK